MPATIIGESRPYRTTTARTAARAALPLILLLLAVITDAAAATPPLPEPRPPAPNSAVGASRDSANIYSDAFTFATRGNWRALNRQRRKPTNPELEKVLTWIALKHPLTRADFDRIARFLDANPHWPDGHQLRMRAEEAMDDDVALDDRLRWFARNPSLTTEGRLKRIITHAAAGRHDDSEAAMRETWYLGKFTAREHRDFIRAYGHQIDQELHWQRLNRLIWLGRTKQARAMLSLVDTPRRRLAEARIRLRDRDHGVDRAIARIPRELREDPGLLYERMRWRRRKGLLDRAQPLLEDAPAKPEFPALWWRERSIQIRRNLDDGANETAHRLARSHRQSAGAAFAEAQWLAGWTALRFLSAPREAIGFFTSMYKAVKTPISRARAAYWAGRSFEVVGDAAKARFWYAEAAQYPTTFYGQLAADRPGSTAVPLPVDPKTSAGDLKGEHRHELMAVATALRDAGQNQLARKFLRALAATTATPASISAAAAFARQLGFLDVSVMAARQAARDRKILIEAGYPVLDLPKGSKPEPALVHAVIRQESNFDAEAQSGAGALGMMQLMPATARQVARGLDVPYRRRDLRRAPVYNIRLGSHYLHNQIKAFDGDYILAVAAYNAGPGRVRQWIRTYGDPRSVTIDPIDWIERIPFSETRNYVQRVLENLRVYRQRLGSGAAGWNLRS